MFVHLAHRPLDLGPGFAEVAAQLFPVDPCLGHCFANLAVDLLAIDAVPCKLALGVGNRLTDFRFFFLGQFAPHLGLAVDVDGAFVVEVQVPAPEAH